MKIKSEIDLTGDFMKIARIAVENSFGKLRLANKEKSESEAVDSEAGHFLKLNGKRIGRDIEVLGEFSKTDKIGRSLPEFQLILAAVRWDCKESYEITAPLLQKLGIQVLDEIYVENWNRIFDY